MKTPVLNDMVISELVERFIELSLGQFNAELYGQIAKFNRLYDEIIALEKELKRRGGDQRSALVPLFAHPNAQVRLNAAQSTLAVAPVAARQVLQDLWDRKQFPQAAYAMGTLLALESGDRKPT